MLAHLKRKVMSAKTKSLPSQNIICLKNKLSWRPEAVSLIQMESDWKPFLKEFGVPGQYFTFDLISIGYEGRSFFWAENQIYGFLLPVWQLEMSSGTTLKTVKCFYHCTDATFHSVSFSKTNPVWFGKVMPKNCVRFSKPIPVWFGKKKIDFARRIFQSKFILVWKILMTIVNVLKIPN